MDTATISGLKIRSSIASILQRASCYRLQQQQSSNQKKVAPLEWRVSAGAALLMLSSLCLIIVAANGEPSSQHESVASAPAEGHRAQQQQQHQQQQRALEAELNSIVQQHDALEGNSKILAEAIISRLMLDNLTGSNLMGGNSEFENEFAQEAAEQLPTSANNQLGEVAALELPAEQQQQQLNIASGSSGYDLMRLKKLMSLLQNFEQPSGSIYSQFPILPSSQAATMKRAAAKMSSYLQPRAVTSAYGRNSFDFGLGKRGPEPSSLIGSSGGASSNILRFGDSSMGMNGGANIQPASQFGKRPSAHRYDFGLGKRVASPTYPRYDFGLGKRAPSRIRYDFGLGKK